jgi:hypothetical protein
LVGLVDAAVGTSDFALIGVVELEQVHAGGRRFNRARLGFSIPTASGSYQTSFDQPEAPYATVWETPSMDMM